MKCLEKDPARRYATALELAEDLERFLKSEPVTARPSGFWQRLRRSARREPALVCRLAGLFAAMLIVHATHFYHRFFSVNQHDTAYHLRIVSVIGAWAVVSFLFQKLLNRERTARFAQFGWAAADVLLLTTLLAIAESPLGPLLIAASGLFFRVRLVVFITPLVVAAYATLLVLRPEEARPLHYPFIFGSALVVLGIMVGYQVHRVRALSRFYDRRRVP